MAPKWQKGLEEQYMDVEPNIPEACENIQAFSMRTLLKARAYHNV